MPNMLDMMKQAASMRKEMKQIQKDLARKTVEASSVGGKITVVARCDMTIEEIRIDPALLDPAKAEQVGQFVTGAVNAAMKDAKKKAGSEMSRLTSGLGLPDLPG